MQEFYNYQPKDVLADTQATQNEDSLLLSIPSQLLYGFLEGMTTLPVARWAGDEPNSTTEQIANSLGSLMGFVGINPIGMTGKIASKLFVKGTMGKYLGALSKNTRFQSLPMYLGNKVANKINTIGLNPALEAMEFTRKNPILKDMAQQAVILGAQMGIAGAPIYDWSLGAMEDRMHSGIMGALFGAGNSLIGNTFTRGGKFDMNSLKEDDINLLLKSDKQLASEAIKASDFRNGLVRAGVSGAIFSIPSMAEGAPLPIVLYDAALNAFFGYKESPYWMKRARGLSEDFIEAPHLLLNPEAAITEYRGKQLWDSLDTRTRNTLQEMADIQLGGMIKNAYDDDISIPGVQMGSTLRDVYKNLKVIPNGQRPEEGEINEWQYKKLEEKYLVQGLIDDAVKESTAKDGIIEDEFIAAKVKEGLYEAAKRGLGASSRLGTFKLFEAFRNIDYGVYEGLTSKTKFEIDKAYKDNGLSNMFAESLDKIVSKTFVGTDSPTEEMFGERYKEVIGMVAKYTKDKNLSYLDFEKELAESYEIEPDPSFKKAYTVAHQSVPRIELTYDIGTNEIRRVANQTARGTVRPTSYEPKPLIYDMLDGDVFEFSTMNDFEPLHESKSQESLSNSARANGFTGDLPGSYAYLLNKLYRTNMNGENSSYNLAFYSGHKDQSKFLVGKFLVTPQQAGELLASRANVRIGTGRFVNDVETTKTLNELYTEGRDRFLKTNRDPKKVQELTDMYQHSFANNIAFIEKFHNRTLVDIAGTENLIGKKTQKNWMLEPFSLMKRTQGLNSRQIRFNALDVAEELYYPKEIATETAQEAPGTTKSPKPPIDTAVRKQQREKAVSDLGDERYIILNAKQGPKGSQSSTHGLPWDSDYKFNVYDKKTGKIVQEAYDAHLDGGAMMRDDIFDAMMKSIGEDPTDMGGFKGVTIHQGDDTQPGFFSKKAVFKAPKKMSDWMRTQNVHTVEYDTTVKVGAGRASSDYTIENGLPVVKNMSVHSRKWDNTTYLMPDETYKLNKPHRIMKQLLTNIGADTPEGVAALRAMEDYFKDRINGKVYNAVVGKNPDGSDILGDKLSDSIQKMVKDGELINDDFIHSALLNDEVGIADRLLIFLSNRDSKAWRFMRDEIFDRDLDNEWREGEENEYAYFEEFGLMDKLFEAATKRKDGTSDLEITPALLSSVNSARNFVESAVKRYLMNEMIKPKVKDSMTSTLTPQFPFVDKHIKRGEIWYGNAAKKQIYDFRTGETLEEAYNRLKDRGGVEVVVIRAPADSPSGIRALKLAGFIDAPGTGAFMHPDEYYNLGGADNDIDKITSYFQLPKEVADYYKTKKDQWYDKNGVAIEAKQNPEYLEEEFGTIPFDSLSNAIVNRNAYKGISILGVGLNHTNRLLTLHDWITQKHGGKYVTSIYAENNEENLAAFREMEKQNADNGFTEWGSEIYHPKVNGVKDTTRLAIKYLAKLNDKFEIYKHQRDIVNYAADASNGEPVKDIWTIKSYVDRDMWKYPFEPKTMKGFKIYNSFDVMYKRLAALDSIYADRNSFEKETLPNGSEVPRRYNIRQIFKIAQEYDQFLGESDGVDGYMYRTYRKLGKAADKYFKSPEMNSYAWIGNASSVRKLVSQANDFYKSKEGKRIVEFFFGRSNFGLAFPDAEYEDRTRSGVETLKRREEEIKENLKYKGMSYIERMEAKSQEIAEDMENMAKSAMGYQKPEPYKPDFTTPLWDYAANRMRSDLRANDVMDLASVWHVASKGKTALENHTVKQVVEVRDAVEDLLVDYDRVRKEKAEGNKTIEADWILKTNEYFNKIESPSLRAFAESLLVSSVPTQKRAFKQQLYPEFETIKKLIKDVDDDFFLSTLYSSRNQDFSPTDAYYFYNSMTPEQLKNFVTRFKGNSDKLYDAILKLKDKGRKYYSSGFNDAVARLPFINNRTLVDLFSTYQTIIDFANKNIETVGMTMSDTRAYINSNLSDGDSSVITDLQGFGGVNFNAKLTIKEQDVYKSLHDRVKNILMKKAYLTPRLEGIFIDWQANESGIKLPVTFKDMTLPQYQKFVDYLESKTFEKSYAIKKSDWYKSPQDIASTVNMYDTKTNKVTMRVAIGNDVKLVNVDIPSSRVNNSILLVDRIHESFSGRIKAIEALISSDSDEEIKITQYEVGSDGEPVLNERGERIKKADEIVVNPNFIKAQIPYDDFQKIFEHALSDHEFNLVKGAKFLDASHQHFADMYNKSRVGYNPLSEKTYSIAFNNRTKRMRGYQLKDELQRFFKAMNGTGFNLINDPYHYKRLFKTKWEDAEFGFGVKGFEESRIIRVTDFLEKMGNDVFSGKLDKYTNMGLNVWQLVSWNNDVYHYRFKVGAKDYRTIEKMIYDMYGNKVKPGTDEYWREYGRVFEELKSKTNTDGTPMYPILSNPPKEQFDMPEWYKRGYFPHREHTKQSIRERAEVVLKKAAPDSKEFRKAQLWMLNEGRTEMADVEESLKDSLFNKRSDDKKYARISASVSGHLKSRNGDYFIPGYRRDFRVYEGYLKDITKQIFDTMMVSVHKHNMSRMQKESITGLNSLTYEDATKMRMFLDIRMLDVLGYPSQLPDNYVDALQLEGTFYHKLTNDYWIRKKSPFIDSLLGIKAGTPEELRATRINRAIASLSNLEATWAMMPLLASPKFMITNRFSGGMTTIINNGMEHFVKAHRLSEVNKYVGSIKSYKDMVDFVSKHGGIESFIKNELVLSQNVKLGDVTEFVKDVMQFYKEGKDVPITRMYELAKQRGITQEFVDKAAYFMRASEIKNRVYTWFAHYMKAHDTLFKGRFNLSGDREILADDPWLVTMANKGVAATQYLYDSLNRPAFARTALGKMLTRFQLYTYNNLRWRKQLMDAARYEDWNSANGKRLANLVSMDMMVLTLATFFPGTMFSASLNQPYGWVKDLTSWIFGDEKERERAFFGSIPYPANIVQPLLPPFTRFLINPIVALFDLEKFSNTLVWSMFPFGRMVNETRKSIENPLLMPEKSFGIPMFTLVRKIQADYKRRDKKEQKENPSAPDVNSTTP